MPVGPSPNLKELARALNPQLLRLLVRDLLSERGFVQIRDFDGTGDGGRDLEGVDPSGKRCVVQLKYREDPEGSTSSTEFAELPMALVRLGRHHGLFITNGRMSAPAKRDAANAFPGLSLAFLEGIDLLNAIHEAPLTAALWFQNGTIGHVLRRATFGTLCRTYPANRDSLVHELCEAGLSLDWEALSSRGLILRVSSRAESFDYGDFEPFSPPRTITSSQGLLDTLLGTEITVHGDWSLDQLQEIQHSIGSTIAMAWSETRKQEVCVVRVGRPTILAARSEGGMLAFQEPTTWIGVGGNAILEADYILESLGCWKKPSWIQAYQESCGLYRLLWSDEDLLCSLSYISMTSRAELGMALARRSRFDHWWGRSLCYLTPRRIPTDEESGDPLAPHLCHEVSAGQWITVWLHPRLQGGYAERQLSGNCRDGDYDPLAETDAELEYLLKAREHAQILSGQALPPKTAYHGLCYATRGEAAPSVMWRTHSTGMLLDYPNTIPSPIDLFAIEPTYSLFYALPEVPEDLETATRHLHDLDSEWQIDARHNPTLDRFGLDYMVGPVPLEPAKRIVEVTMQRCTKRRVLLSDRLSSDAVALSALLAKLEGRIPFSRQFRNSRGWLRDRWRVYFQPEYPAENEQTVLFDKDGKPLSISPNAI